MAAFQFPDPAVNSTVVNPITGSTYQWKEPPGKWVLIAQPKTQVSDLIWEGDNPPAPPEDYKLWYSTDTLELYFYYCDDNGTCAWIPTSKPITMLDDLDTAVAELRTDIQAVNIATSENENRIGRTIFFSDTAPEIFPDVVYDDTSFPSELNYKFWYDTERLELLILFRDVDGDDSYVPVSIPLESIPDPGVSPEVFTYTTGRLQTAIEENYLHNLDQDTSIAGIKNDIVELEEEIDAIAPSVERGVWKFNLGGAVSSRGQITMYDGMDKTGSPIGLFKSAQSVWLNELDSNGTPHGFANVVEGDLLELFVEGDADYGLFTVVATHDETEGTNKFWVIDVEFVRSLTAESKADNADNLRVKIIKPPSGGTVDGFVLTSGDTMTGDLTIDRSEGGPSSVDGAPGKVATLELKGDRTGSNDPAAVIAFDNASSSNPGYLSYRSDTGDTAFFRFTKMVKTKEGLATDSITTIGSSTKTTFDKQLDFTLEDEINARFQYGFVIKDVGETIDGLNTFWANNEYVRYSKEPTDELDVCNKKYVDENVRPIQVLPGNPPDAKVGDAWFSTNQNTFIIKIS